MPKTNHAIIQQLQNSNQLAKAVARLQRHGLATGYEALNQALPTGGWPLGALTELLVPRLGIGEFRLLLPILVKATQQKQWAALVRPPWVPNPHALGAAGADLRQLRIIRAENHADALWATDQLLRSGAFRLVIAWPGRLQAQAIRKLQLAAESGQCCGFLIRSVKNLQQASMAPLRIRLDPQPPTEAEFLDNPYRQILNLHIVKCRGMLRQREITIAMNLLND